MRTPQHPWVKPRSPILIDGMTCIIDLIVLDPSPLGVPLKNTVVRVLFACLLIMVGAIPWGMARGQEAPRITAERLLETGKMVEERSHYIEALDLFNEARSLLEREGRRDSSVYADVMFMSAQTKIKARLHQSFPASYVKTALEEVQAANKIREGITGVLPQKLAEGYYLEGMIHKRFFMRTAQAQSCFVKAVTIDPGCVAAKRELSELVAQEEK